MEEAVRHLRVVSSENATLAISNQTRDVVMGLGQVDHLEETGESEPTVRRHGMDLRAEHHPLLILEPIVLRVDLVSRSRHPRIHQHLDYRLGPELL